MSDLLYETKEHLALLTLNRINRHNAFNKHLLQDMHHKLNEASADARVRVIVLKANGTHFSSGADLAWMQEMAQFNQEENLQDAMVLGNLMYALHSSLKPTVAMIHGCAFGGGAGLAAACDISIAGHGARFCFSEVRLGLIPAVISPYVIQAIGARQAKALFMSAEIFDAAKALSLNLIQHCVAEEQLLEFTLHHAQQISNNAPEAVRAAKQLVHNVTHRQINRQLVYDTASLIAQKRISPEGQQGLNAFLKKETPNWE